MEAILYRVRTRESRIICRNGGLDCYWAVKDSLMGKDKWGRAQARPYKGFMRASLLRFGALAAVFFQLIMKCFQADAEQFRRPRFVVSRCPQRLQDKHALHRINRCSNGKLDRRKIAWPFPARLAKLSRQARARTH